MRKNRLRRFFSFARNGLLTQDGRHTRKEMLGSADTDCTVPCGV